MEQTTNRIWNLALDLVLAPASMEYGRGITHLVNLLRVNTFIMANGLEQALGTFDIEAFEAAAAACDYFDLQGAADIFRRLAMNKHDYDLADSLNPSYWDYTGQRGGQRNGIEIALERRMQKSPEDFELPER